MAADSIDETRTSGALVISLDFEMFWGVRDFLTSDPAYWQNIRGEKAAVRAILDLFREYDISATWATVGFLFADSAQELITKRPSVLPSYDDTRLSPYAEDHLSVCDDESLLFALETIQEIKETAGQEIATHTFSHYYCLDPGQTPQAFEADIRSAVQIANENSVEVSSIVFPRNQHNPEYDEILLRHGINCYRGNQRSRMYHFDTPTLRAPHFRAARLLDTFINLSGFNAIDWNDVRQNGLTNVAASMFLRPVAKHDSIRSDLQYRRITRAMTYAARNNKVFHLWWHPHNFGVNLDENILFLKRILDCFRELSEQFGCRSLSMNDVAVLAHGDREVPLT